jgi:tetratricopeptide (TPR) repeat protein
MQAWETGAKQWREQSAKSQAGFLPVHEAWELYEPVGFSGEVGALALPAEDTVVSAYLQEVMKFIEAELYPRVSRLEQQIEDSGENPRYINSLGVLYARYGLSDKAAQEFQRILRREEYLPALINMGNLAFLDGDLNRALSYYQQAYKRQPNNPTVMLSLAKVNHELANYGEVDRLYGLLKKQDPELAERYTYLDLKAADETARASEAQRMKDVMIWEE